MSAPAAPPPPPPARTPRQEVLPPEPRWYRQVYNEKYGSW